MGNLYLINKEYGENGLRLAQYDKEAIVVLLQDGVYIDPKLYPPKAKIYAIKQDVEKRGLGGKLSAKYMVSFGLPKQVEYIDYYRLVDLVVENKVINFA
ncbi:MAG: DsrH/TusB family sulfur metabolism protein [Candidatus Brocadiales bacterium]